MDTITKILTKWNVNSNDFKLVKSLILKQLKENGKDHADIEVLMIPLLAKLAQNNLEPKYSCHGDIDLSQYKKGKFREEGFLEILIFKKNGEIFHNKSNHKTDGFSSSYIACTKNETTLRFAKLLKNRYLDIQTTDSSKKEKENREILKNLENREYEKVNLISFEADLLNLYLIKNYETEENHNDDLIKMFLPTVYNNLNFLTRKFFDKNKNKLPKKELKILTKHFNNTTFQDVLNWVKKYVKEFEKQEDMISFYGDNFKNFEIRIGNAMEEFEKIQSES